ncbi:MAG: hypothetical protein NVSMB62_27790 [Acidobacteriaceae bacterium]
MLTVWGFDPAVSKVSWDSTPQGAAGYRGATMRIDLSGQGKVDASVTFADMSLDRASHLASSTGVVGGLNYMLLTNA